MTIILATLNAKYIHASFGLRYLKANLGTLSQSAEIQEFEISTNPLDIVERILAKSPKIVGLGVYIWNIEESSKVVQVFKQIAPEVVLVLGGPEVSFETLGQPIVGLADYIICGEADIAFRELCEAILDGSPPTEKVIRAKLPVVSELVLPYELYTDDDIKNRIVYVEASRGCPFTCEFCLSSIDIPVRQIEPDILMSSLEQLYQRGLRSFKFVDRTFNLNIRTANQILQFFLDRMEPGLFVHFEMVPDRFPVQLREVVQQFPAGSLQFEVGIQSFNPEVGALISRRQDFKKIEENLKFLRHETGVYIHADLIVGLPGEDLASFARGFDTLVKLDPHEIQVGILKRLRGAPIIRHDEEWQMRYSSSPPYEVLSTKNLTFLELQAMRRFAKFWDLISNSGNFKSVKYLIWRDQESPFDAFMALSEWLHQKFQRRSAIGLKALAGSVYEYLCSVMGLDPDLVGGMLVADYASGGRIDLPPELRRYVPDRRTKVNGQPDRQIVKLKRQARAIGL